MAGKRKIKTFLKLGQDGNLEGYVWWPDKHDVNQNDRICDCRPDFDNRGERAFLSLPKEDLQVKKTDLTNERFTWWIILCEQFLAGIKSIIINSCCLYLPQTPSASRSTTCRKTKSTSRTSLALALFMTLVPMKLAIRTRGSFTSAQEALSTSLITKTSLWSNTSSKAWKLCLPSVIFRLCSSWQHQIRHQPNHDHKSSWKQSARAL